MGVGEIVFGAIIGGVTGYIVYRFRCIHSEKKLTQNMIKTIAEDRFEREIIIDGKKINLYGREEYLELPETILPDKDKDESIKKSKKPRKKKSNKKKSKPNKVDK